MPGWDPSAYGEAIADVYDDWYADATDVEGTVTAVAALGTSVLELGIGTGRLAIPMADAGMRVAGIDASPAMVARLHEKRPGIPVAIGDFTDTTAEGRFDVVLCAFNSLLNLLTLDDQERCLRNAVDHLEPGGAVVVETFVPSDEVPGSGLDVRKVEPDEVQWSVFTVVDRIVSGSIVTIREDGPPRLRPWRIRLTTPDELDEVAQRAGLERASRHAGWRGEPFTTESDRQVTVYRASGR
jgi:SAM-dependent methyltransferase